jgi:hypothetical protein
MSSPFLLAAFSFDKQLLEELLEDIVGRVVRILQAAENRD